MAYNENLGLRISHFLADEPGLLEKKDGNMACGVIQDALIVRVGADAYQSALDQPHVRPFDMTGRPMSGWVMVDLPGIADEEALEAWIRQGCDFARSLPPK